MNFSKLTSKFQVTIPKEIRALLKLKSRDYIVFEILEDGTVILRKCVQKRAALTSRDK